jgi:hypothetical protein
MCIRKFTTPLIAFLFISCVGQNNTIFTPEPDFSVFYVPENFINKNNIIQTRDGTEIDNIPNWLIAYIDGGIEAVEKLDVYSDKYVFIAENEGDNFLVLNKWIENFSEKLDFPIIAAARIDKRIISFASLYPDNEYGRFYEVMIKNAYSGEYTGTVKEDTYWIKIWYEQENTWEYAESYKFFILLTINKTLLQPIIRSMMIRAVSAVTVSSAQSNAIDRLRHNFFERF